MTLIPQLDGVDLADVGETEREAAYLSLLDGEAAALEWHRPDDEDETGDRCARCSEELDTDFARLIHAGLATDQPAEVCPDDFLHENITCRNCGDPLEWVATIDAATGERGTAGRWGHTWADGSQWCDAAGDGNANEADPEQVATREPLHWLNWASVSLDPGDNAVRFNVSTGEPRGSHQFTARYIEAHDEGGETVPERVILHVPYPGQAEPHTGLRPMHEGTFEEIGYSEMRNQPGGIPRPVYLNDAERAIVAHVLDHWTPNDDEDEAAEPTAEDIAAIETALAKVRRAG